VYADDARLIVLPDNDSVANQFSPEPSCKFKRNPLFSTSATRLAEPRWIRFREWCSIRSAALMPENAADQRILDDVLQQRSRDVLKSQKDVGGWPDLSR